jgi:hypothetical protein
VYKQLNTYDLILCSVHTVRIPENDAFRKLTAAKPVVLTFFTLPYYCKEYAASINNAKGMLVGYENTDAAQAYAAQLIFGGIAGKGKLSVTYPTYILRRIGTRHRTGSAWVIRSPKPPVSATRLSLRGLTVLCSSRDFVPKAFPGCQVLVGQRRGNHLHTKSFGYYTYDNLQPETERRAGIRPGLVVQSRPGYCYRRFMKAI